jgi:GNAT superfamily N-acetyltransferase
MKENKNITFRYEVADTDPETIQSLVRSTGFFYEHEIAVAGELASERLAKGDESGYHFVFAMLGNQTAAYACYGATPCTEGAFDLYWIATHNDFRGKGFGAQVLNETIGRVQRLKGRLLIAETSARPQYLPTRLFYEKCGFVCEAQIGDFYAPGDHKLVFVKRLL